MAPLVAELRSHSSEFEACRIDHTVLERSTGSKRVHHPEAGELRLHYDILFLGPRVAVFLDGCFWHGWPEHATRPRANAEWWRTKLDRNISRDRETTAHLTAEGWTVLGFWEHQPPRRWPTQSRT